MVRATAEAMPAGRHLSVGLQVFTPNLSGPDDLAERVAAAKGAGATAFNFYNYGLIPRARLDWIRSALGTS